MRSSIFSFLRVLKLPVRLLRGWIRKRRKRNELEQKYWKHVRNFAPRSYVSRGNLEGINGKNVEKNLKVNNDLSFAKAFNKDLQKELEQLKNHK